MTSAHAVYPSLADRVAFVTGGGSGIGAAIVAAFAQQKAKVAFVDVDEKASGEVQARRRSISSTSSLPRRPCCPT